MPTGYTADVQDGKVTSLKEFALKCARSRGALVHMKDEPFDRSIYLDKVSDYHLKELEKAKKEFAKYKKMSLEDVENIWRAKSRKAHKEDIKRSTIVLEEKARYLAMLEKVKAWTPPTPAHKDLKNFMIEQLKESIEFDCSRDYYTEDEFIEAKETLPKEDLEEYKQEMIASAQDDIGRHQKEYDAEVKRVNDRNTWITQLINSFKE